MWMSPGCAPCYVRIEPNELLCRAPGIWTTSSKAEETRFGNDGKNLGFHTLWPRISWQ
jgi:hypothetical protein